MDYAELTCRSCFSFLQGASMPEDLIARAHAQGYQALALTDEASVSGSVRAHLALQSLQEADAPSSLQLLHGAQFLLADTPLRLALIVLSRTGWQQLCRLITSARRQADKGHYHLTRQMLQEHPLSDCHLIWLPDPRGAESILASHAQWLRTTFPGQAHIGCSLLRRADDRAWLQQLMTLGALFRLPLVATGDVCMARRSDKPLADLLTAIRLRRPLADCGQQLLPNAEQSLRSRLQLARLYPPELRAAGLEIAQRCRFSLDELRYEYPDEIVPAGLTPTQWLRHLTEEGARQRFPDGTPAPVRQQIEHELGLITELRYEPYFLTVYDIVAFARSRGILCQGRGSAANSAVCYCLGITEVDPSRMNMLFERFISRERNEPPDIDVDFEHQRREEVIQYIYGKYGRDRAALAAALIRYRPRSALRDAGKALGINAELIDQAARGRSWWDGQSIQPEGLQDSLDKGLERLAALPRLTPLPSPPTPQQLQLWAQMSAQLLGLPRHLSQHVGGFVIARHRLSDLVAVENAAMAERSILQWDKDDIDALGLLKVDVLALGMLSAIRRSLEAIGQKLGRASPLPIQEVPAEDPETYQMISAADTVGVFQIESRAQMSMLPRLQPQCFYDLVIEVAIVRPGPIQGGMVHPYLRRRQGLEPVDYPGPGVRKALERTLGVPIFQEQVMQLAVLAAGFTPGEADQLRRAMAAWRRRGTLGPFHERLVAGMLSRGYTSEFAERVFAQIQGFGEYGFPESHAASFALLVYVSCWIKRHHPDAFLVALLNSQPMGFYAPAQLVRDARQHGVEIRPVDVHHSEIESCLEQGPCGPRGLWPVRLGLGGIQGLSQEGALRLVQRRQEQPFQSLEDLHQRCRLSRRDLDCLARAGALKSLAGHRHAAVWKTSGLESALPLERAAAEQEAFCVEEEGVAETVPDAVVAPSEAQDLLADYASQGLTLGRHPLALLRPLLLQRFRSQPAVVLRSYPDGRIARASGLVTHRQRPGTARGIVFLSLEDETGSIALVIPPKVLARCKDAVLQGRLVTAYGRWQRDTRISPEASGQVMSLRVDRLEDHTALMAEAIGGLQPPSRDFH